MRLSIFKPLFGGSVLAAAALMPFSFNQPSEYEGIGFLHEKHITKRVMQRDGSFRLECEHEIWFTDSNRRSRRVDLDDVQLADHGGLRNVVNKWVKLSGSLDHAGIDARALALVTKAQLSGRYADIDVKRAVPITALDQPKTRVEGNFGPLMAQAPETRKYLVVAFRCNDTLTVADPHPAQWYRDIYSAVLPGMDHYTREVSYNKVNLVGSQVFAWVNLPGNESDYRTGGWDTSKIVPAVVAALDDQVDFRTIWGVTVFPNKDDNSGFSYATWAPIQADGVNWWRPVAMNNTWADQMVVAHEKGHNFGLPHTSIPGLEYQNDWSPMGNGGRWFPNVIDPFGTIANHHNSPHKIDLNWIERERIFVALPGTDESVRLERIARPLAGHTYQAAKIYIRGRASHYYTVEARKTAGYDSATGLRTTGVIIHDVDKRDDSRGGKPYLVDPGRTGGASAAFQVGTTFADDPNGIRIQVLSEDASGITVRIMVDADAPNPWEVRTSVAGTAVDLYDAIEYANDFPGTTIRFMLPTTDPSFRRGRFILRPTGALPPITADGTTIDASTQTAFTGDTFASGPEVVLDGIDAAFAPALDLSGNDVTVKDLTFVNWAYSAALVIRGDRARVVGCHIGFDSFTRTAAPNGDGIFITDSASNAQIGGPNAADRNVVSGNTLSGIAVFGETSENNTVQGNFVGVLANGNSVMANPYGILLFEAPGTTIAGNRVAGNSLYGILAEESPGTVIKSNAVGINSLGTRAVPNGQDGIIVFLSPGSTVGGPTPADGNVSSGNLGSGIWVEDSSDVLVQNNIVGVRPDQSSVLSNSEYGIVILGGASGGTSVRNNVVGGNVLDGIAVDSANAVQIQFNSIGISGNGRVFLPNANGVAIYSGWFTHVTNNVIARNRQSGVYVTGSAFGATIRGNSMSRNRLSGIDLEGGIELPLKQTPNDPLDLDEGPNSLSNWPSIEGIVGTPTGVQVRGKLEALRSTTYIVDFYAADQFEGLIFGEGGRWLGSMEVTTSREGVAFFNTPLSGDPGTLVVATATHRLFGHTSEFGSFITAPLPTLTVGTTGGARGTSVELTASLRARARNQGVPGRALTFLVGGVPVGTARTDGLGAARIPYVIPAGMTTGPRTIEVRFAGDAQWSAITSVGVLNVR